MTGWLSEERIHRHVQDQASSNDPQLQQAARNAMSSVRIWLPKSTCLVLGPGLGTDPVMAHTAKLALQEARKDVRRPSRTTHAAVLLIAFCSAVLMSMGIWQCRI